MTVVCRRVYGGAEPYAQGGVAWTRRLASLIDWRMIAMWNRIAVVFPPPGSAICA